MDEVLPIGQQKLESERLTFVNWVVMNLAATDAYNKMSTKGSVLISPITFRRLLKFGNHLTINATLRSHRTHSRSMIS
jgi:hypothetical protein